MNFMGFTSLKITHWALSLLYHNHWPKARMGGHEDMMNQIQAEKVWHSTRLSCSSSCPTLWQSKSPLVVFEPTQLKDNYDPCP